MWASADCAMETYQFWFKIKINSINERLFSTLVLSTISKFSNKIYIVILQNFLK